MRGLQVDEGKVNEWCGILGFGGDLVPIPPQTAIKMASTQMTRSKKGVCPVQHC
jgi:hypothetical protein